MKKVYVITAGEYSDYHICAVTDNWESAENLRMLNDRKWSPAQIEEYTIDQMKEPPKSYWHITYRLNGENTCCEQYHYTDGVNEPEEEVAFNCFIFYVDVVCEDKNKALKIAQDRIAQYKYEHMEEVEKEKARYKAMWNNVPYVQASASCTGIVETFINGKKLYGNGVEE